MNSFLRTVLIILISNGIFTLLFNKLYKTNENIFSFIHKIPDSWKGKWFVRWVILVVIITIITLLVVNGLNDIIGTIIIGFFMSLADIALNKPK